MSQFQNLSEGSMHSQEPIDGPKPTSALAVTAFVMSLICCCPLTTLPGAILGLIATFTTMGSARKKGTGLAIAAVILGTVFTIGWIVGGGWMWKNVYGPLFKGPHLAMTAAFDGDYDAFRTAMYSDAAVASDEEIEAWVTQVRDRYGAYQNTAADHGNAQNPQVGATTIPYPYILTFDNGNMSSTVQMVMGDPANPGAIIVKPSIIVIHDPDLGDLTFPPIDPGP